MGWIFGRATFFPGTSFNRLRFYAGQFPLVEVDSSYYDALADQADQLHALFNNCYRDSATRNALQLRTML